MRIVIDARMVGPTGHGIALYVQQLAKGLAAAKRPYEPFYLLSPECPKDSELRALPHAESQIPFLDKRELWALRQEIANLKPALYHSPSFSSLLRYPCPHVQTVHDLNHLHFGGWKEKLYYRFALLPSLKKAKALATVSETSAGEIREWLAQHGIHREVFLAPNAIEEFPSESAALTRFGLKPGEYFFVLSNPKPHKNLTMLIKAYQQARAQSALPPLVISTTGESAQGVIHTGPLQDPEVGALLHHAKSFFFPSLYEGFGRPPLEAALAGTIPVVSSLPVHREALAGVKEAIFLDPNAAAQWQESFLKMANSKERVSLTSKDWIRSHWTAEKLAQSMDSIYRACLSTLGASAKHKNFESRPKM